MRLRVKDTVIIGGEVIEPGIGNFEPEFAKELIRIGSAYEVKEGTFTHIPEPRKLDEVEMGKTSIEPQIDTVKPQTKKKRARKADK